MLLTGLAVITLAKIIKSNCVAAGESMTHQQIKGFIMKINFCMTKKEFIDVYQERKPVLFKKVLNSDEFSWDDANGIYNRSDVSSKDFKLAYNGIRPKGDYVETYSDIGVLRHRLIKPAVYDYLRKGGTLIANRIVNEPIVSMLARQIGEYTDREVVSSAYVAFGEQSSFRAHWDTRDVFAVQLIGRKRWEIFEPSLEMPLYMQQSKDYEHAYPCPEKPCMDLILEPGDILYIPRGWWHNPLPLGEPTFHLAFGTFPTYAMQYLEWAMKLMPNYLSARRSLIKWDDDEQTIKQMGEDFIKLIDNKDLYDQFIMEHMNRVRIDSPLAMEIFGNNEGKSIPRDFSLHLNTSIIYQKDSEFVISNGTRLNLDTSGGKIIKCIMDNPGISITTLCEMHPDLLANKIDDLINNLCREDVISYYKK